KEPAASTLLLFRPVFPLTNGSRIAADLLQARSRFRSMVLPIRVAIADDHPVVRDGLRRILEIEPDISVVGEAASGSEAIALAEKLQPDVLLLDLMMPGVSGLDALRESDPQRLGETRVLVLTAVSDRRQLVEAVRMRVHGIISKDESIDKL